MTVQSQKHAGSEKGGAFVPINEWMVFSESKGIGGSAVKNIWLPVKREILWPHQRRISQAFVANACRATVQNQAFAVQES